MRTVVGQTLGDVKGIPRTKHYPARQDQKQLVDD